MAATTTKVILGLGLTVLVLALIPWFFTLILMGLGSVTGLVSLVCSPDSLPAQAGALGGPGLLLLLGSGLLLVGGLILVGAWAGRRLGLHQPVSRAEPALVILQRRYAAGETDPEDYARLRADLLRDMPRQ